MKNLNHYTPFLIKKSGEIVKYNNYTNGLYGEDLTPWSKVNDNPIEHQPTTKKSNRPYWLRILLGHACNYDCSYCMQKDIGNPNERAKISTLDSFLESVNKLDLSNINKIDLWGGETLLYWKTIVPIIESLDREGFQWFIPTNGVPLRPKHAEFFDKLKARVGIGLSHDGPGHEDLRGKEFLWNEKTIETLKMIEKSNNIGLSFNVVLTNTNYNLIEINDFFRNYLIENDMDPKNFALTFNTAKAYYDPKDLLSASFEHVIHGEDLDKFKDIMDDYLEKCRQQEFEGKDHGLMKNSLFHFGLGTLPYVRSLKEQSLPNLVTSCGVDDEEVLSIDIRGNVRVCPHIDDSDIAGRMDAIEDVELTGLDLERYDKHCGKCPVFRLCKSTCPIKVPDNIFFANCKSSKVFHKSIQRTAFKILFNSEVDEISDT